MNNQVSDFIIRLKNACLAKRREIVMPYSNINRAIGKLLVKKHFLTDLKEEVFEGKKVLVAVIRYERREPVITDVSIVSKPSLKIYAKLKTLGKNKNKTLGVSVLSTSKGIITEEEAKEKGVGGELLFRIW